MRKFFVSLLAAFAMYSAQAQHVNTELPINEVESEETDVDSLKQVITTLEDEKAELLEQERLRKIWKRKKYFNLIYGNDDLKITGDEAMKLKSDIHAGMGMGRTFYLHKKPIAKMIKFGLDWTYFQADYSKYTSEEAYVSNTPSYGDGSYLPSYETEKIDMHKAEIGMQIGPSLTINPVNYLMVSGYFRYAPSFSIFYDGDEVSKGYGSYFVSGGALSYKMISVGVEARWGETKYDKLIAMSDFEEDYNPDYQAPSEPEKKSKFKTSGLRFYVSFRF